MAHGDPALLLPVMFPRIRRYCHPYRLVCVVPHHSDYDLVGQELSAVSQPVSLIFPNATWQNMLNMLLDCGLVLSSSLHGLIFAEAFGVPARWLQLRGSAHSEGKLAKLFNP